MYDIRNLSIWKKEPEKKKQDSELLCLEISELNLSVRSYNCLKRAGCNTIGDILALLKEDENRGHCASPGIPTENQEPWNQE